VALSGGWDANVMGVADESDGRELWTGMSRDRQARERTSIVVAGCVGRR